MFNIEELLQNNTHASERTSEKSNALKEGKDYIQIAVRKQRGKQYINAIFFNNVYKNGKQLNKQKALAFALDYINGFTPKNTIIAMQATLEKALKEYAKNNKLKEPILKEYYTKNNK